MTVVGACGKLRNVDKTKNMDGSWYQVIGYWD